MNQNTDTFGIALEFVLDHEGGYVNDSDDPGGETRFGISKRAHPDVDIVNLTREGAALIYWEAYWQKARCEDFPAALAIALFDGAVNHGPGSAVLMLQQALGVAADGIVGPVTLAAAQQANGRRVINDLLTRRVLLYNDITKANSRQARFLRGWIRRVLDLHQLVATHV